MALEGWTVEPISFQTAKPFVVKWHYSQSIKGLKIQYCFGLFRPRPEFFDIPELVGVLIYALPGMHRVSAKYLPHNPGGCIELVRLCCIDDTPKNTESFFISKTLRWLKKNTEMELVLSYADPMHGHTGIVYRASNFEYVGLTEARKRYIIDGVAYHERGFSKPFAAPKFEVARRRYDNGDPDVYFERQKAKHIYKYRL